MCQFLGKNNQILEVKDTVNSLGQNVLKEVLRIIS